MDALKTRGETEITLAGRTYKLKSSFQALAAIEQTLGLGIFQVANRIKKADMRISDVAVCVIQFATAAKEKKLDADAIGEALFQEGYIMKAGPVVQLLMEAISAGVEEIPGGPKATEKETTPP